MLCQILLATGGTQLDSTLELHDGIDGNCRRALSICRRALLFVASSTAFQCRDALFPCCRVPFSCNQPSPNHPRPRSPSDHQHPGADPGFVERGGAAAVPFEDPLWNFKRGAQGACALFGPP